MYFPNGTSNMIWVDNNCSDCIHLDKDGGCPVMDVHCLLNYRQCKDNEIKLALNVLIDEKTQECKMKKTKDKILDCNKCLIQNRKEEK